MAIRRREDGEYDNRYVPALARGLRILNAFAPPRESLSHMELVETTGLSKNQVCCLTRTLVMEGYLQQDSVTKRFSLTPRVSIRRT